MLDMGFQGDVAALSSQVRPERQVLFFSATWSAAVQELARGLCHQGARPVRISVGQHAEDRASGDPDRQQAREGIVQEVVVVDFPKDHVRQAAEKERLLDEHLHQVLTSSEDHKVLVFVSQKQFADELATKLWEAGFTAASMHGGKSQESRLWTLDQFRKGDLRLLVATDVIGRGIDIPSVSHVVVFEMGSIDDYVHRIGRTARGKHGKGHALVFFEYWNKDGTIAGQLAELLSASKQPVPEGLARIASEFERGEREVFGSKWKAGGSSWGTSNKWDPQADPAGWSSGGRAANQDPRAERSGPSPSTGASPHGARGHGGFAARGTDAAKAESADAPESWDDAS